MIVNDAAVSKRDKSNDVFNLQAYKYALKMVTIHKPPAI